MKKLLSILAATGLVTTSTISVIACSKKNDDKEEFKLNRTQIIKDFTEEVNKIIVNHVEKIPSLTILDTDSAQYKFLNADTLKSKMKEQTTETITISASEKTNLVHDFNELMKITDLKNEINKLADRDEYSVILSSLPNKEVFGEIKFSFDFDNKDKIRFFATGSDKNFYANVFFDYEFQIYYENSPGEIVSMKRPKAKEEFEFLITGDKDFYDSIIDMKANIKKGIINEGIIYDQLQEKTKTTKTKLEDLTSEIQDFYNKKDSELRTKLPETIKNEYFKELGSRIELDFFQNEDIVEINKQNDWLYKYRSNSEKYNNYRVEDVDTSRGAWFNHFLTYDEKKFPIEGEEGKEDQKQRENSQILKSLQLIYKEELAENDESSINKILKILDQKPHNKEKTEYEVLEDDFKSKLSTELTVEQWEKVGSESIDRVTQLGTMVVNNLQATIAGKIFKIPGSFRMYVNYLPIEKGQTKGTRMDEPFRKDIAKNILTGLLGFRNVYEIHVFGSSFKAYSIGVMKKNANLFNLWGKWDEKNLNYINDQINLKTKELEETRKKLFNLSKQEHFYYTFVGSGKDKKTYDIKTLTESIVLEIDKNSNNKDSTYKFQFEMDYFRVQISIDMKDKLVFQMNLMAVTTRDL